MSGRLIGRLAWGLGVLSLLLFLTGSALELAAASSGVGVRIPEVVLLALVVVFSAVGALIASRHPRNAIGWIFCGVAVAVGLGKLAGGYAGYWISGMPASDALGETAAWYANNSWIPFVLVPPTFVLLLFPDGRLLSRRWRPVAWCAGVAIIGVFLGDALSPGPLLDYPQITNPYAVESPLLFPLQATAYLLMLAAGLGSVLSLFLRFRRADREQRQQIKWLTWAGALAVVMLVANTLGYDLVGETVANTLIMLGVLSLPLATGIAILRYRLYDIDLLINRTIVYGALTATLVAAYFAGVTLLQWLFRALTGQEQQAQLAIVASTLVIAALFNPLRRRIQAFIDRRFYRRKYDAAKTLDAFSARLRDETDLGKLGDDLTGVVREAVQPAHVSLWLRRTAETGDHSGPFAHSTEPLR